MRTIIYAFASAIVSLAILVPASAAVNHEACDAAAAYSEARSGVSVLVLKDGEIVCERYALAGGVEKPFELWSGTKSLTGLMAAAAVQDGLLNLDELVADSVPEWRSDKWKAQVSVRQLLSLVSGLESEMGNPPGYRDAVVMPLVQMPGTHFSYGPAPFQLFGEIMRRKLIAAGLDGDPLVYLRRRILTPIGVGEISWRRGSDKMPLLPQGAIMSAREWARVGELVRNGGRFGGKQILDSHILAELFVGSQPNPAYGLGWWLPRKPIVPDVASSTLDVSDASIPNDLIISAGAGFQRLYVIPSRRLTIVRQAIFSRDNAQKSTWSDKEFLTELGAIE